MDASEYLRYKKRSCATTIARNKCIDAGLRTDMLSKAANTTYQPPYSTIGIVQACCPTAVETAIRYGGDYTTAIKPTEKCGVTCTSFTDKYNAKFITQVGCPVPYMSTIYLSPCKVQEFQGTQFDNFKVINNFNGTSNCGPKY
jgi:hypothetical protein